MTSRPPTVVDIAKEAGVSKTTAVAILNNKLGFRTSEETRERVLAVATRLGYQRNALASALSRGRTGAIAVLIPVFDGRDPYAQRGAYLKDVVLEVATALAGAGLGMVLISATSEILANPHLLANGMYDGVLLAPIEYPGFAERVIQLGLPVVSIGPGDGPHQVRHDNARGIHLAYDHLWGLGHRRIAYMGSGIDAGCNRERTQAYMEIASGHSAYPANLLDSIKAAEEALSRRDRPTAIICFNDSNALQLMRVARMRGISIPEELSITGFDDSILAIAAHPSLTSIQTHLDTQAHRAVQALLELQEGVSVPPLSQVEVSLIARESTGPVPISY